MYPISEKDWNRYKDTVLDHGLNVAILVIARRLFPDGFDVSEDAPDTYEKLVAQFDSGKRYVVFSGAAEGTIYGDREVNYHFRAWHDWCHWHGQHDFSLQGEFGAYSIQCEHLIKLYGASEISRRWERILFAEVIGQKLYSEEMGAFPSDQMAFVKAFLAGKCDDVLSEFAGRRERRVGAPMFV